MCCALRVCVCVSDDDKIVIGGHKTNQTATSTHITNEEIFKLN